MHMTFPHRVGRLLGRLALGLAVALPAAAFAQADLPGRVARIGLQDGSAVVTANGQSAWSPTDYNVPLTTGARIVSDPGARTELHAGSTALRLLGRADLTFAQLDDDNTRITLADGGVSARVRDLHPGDRLEINTPNLALVAQQPGEYRVDVDPRASSTRVTVHSGVAQVFGEGGESVIVNAHQQLLFGGRRLARLGQGGAYGRDAFDQWVASRDAAEDQSRTARYVSREIPGYHQLDQYGDWSEDASYGAVWFPRVEVSDWAPYRYGRWDWVEPWGWTWVDDAPWGFAPFHYGRWTQIGPRWAWVPGPLRPRPAYAPALVGFVGGGGNNWGVSLGNGPRGAAWFPLAPGERWEPHYGASSRYRSRINPWDERERVRPPADHFHFQRRPNAITVSPHDQFGGADGQRRGRYFDGSRLPADQFGNSRVVSPPPRAYVPGMQPLDGLGMGVPRPDASSNSGMPPRPDFSGSSRPRPINGQGMGKPRPDASNSGMPWPHGQGMGMPRPDGSNSGMPPRPDGTGSGMPRPHNGQGMGMGMPRPDMSNSGMPPRPDGASMGMPRPINGQGMGMPRPDASVIGMPRPDTADRDAQQRAAQMQAQQREQQAHQQQLQRQQEAAVEQQRQQMQMQQRQLQQQREQQHMLEQQRHRQMQEQQMQQVRQQQMQQQQRQMQIQMPPNPREPRSDRSPEQRLGGMQ